MNDFYIMDILSISEEYIIPKLNSSLEKDLSHYFRDERWYLSAESETIEIDEGGVEIPDILSKQGMIFFSDRLKKIFEKIGVDYIFYKPIIISDEILGIKEYFWLTSIPRIDCIDFEKSEIENKDEYDYNDGIVPFYNIANPIIISECCGRYEIFRLLGSSCNRIFVTGAMKQKIESEKLVGIGFRKIRKKEFEYGEN